MQRKTLIINYLNLFNMSKLVTRSTVNEQQYAAPAFSKSGFQLTHRRYSSFILGRIHCSGYQDTMPGDKISGKNDGTFTFNNIVTPMMPNIDVQQYNFLLTLRSLDRTFERAFAPSKNNEMSLNWQAPSVFTQDLVEQIFNAIYTNDTVLTYLNALIAAGTRSQRDQTLSDVFGDSVNIALYGNGQFDRNVQSIVGAIHAALYSSATNDLYKSFVNLYLTDVIDDILQNVRVKLGSLNHPISGATLSNDFLYNLLDCILSPFVGRYSYYGELKYNYIRPKDLYVITSGAAGLISTLNDLILVFDDTPLNEYALRAIYAIWYEYFRNVDLEPVSGTLPYWRDFGSSPVVRFNLAMLVLRPRPWYEDMFVSAQIDDLSRHVWAPVVNSGSNQAAVHNDNINNLDVQNVNMASASKYGGHVNPSIYQIGWRDQLSGEAKTISCPVPTNINDILSATDNDFINVYGVDLTSLRQAQQLERYLKRNYLFGDEYNDRMLAHYNSRVSDMRINRPEIISQSFNSSDNKQEIANMSNGISNAGDRTATATIKASGDQYSTFCEEFGMLMHIITFMPTSCYDGIHPQLLLSKVNDYPLPEFATNNEEFGRKIEIASSGLMLSDEAKNMFGRYPAYHAWRQRIDEVGGMFLDEMQDCTFRRFWGFDSESIPMLNYHFIHCRPSLQMFRNTNVYDSQIYGDVVHECYVERVLPTPVENI